MADYQIFPAPLLGKLQAPPSKSAAHRALICAALAQEGGTVAPISHSEDMEATLGVLSAMGCKFTRQKETVVFSKSAHLTETSFADTPVVLDCGESGSTLRFLLPIAAALGLPALFTGRGRLPERPIGVLADEMEKHGIVFSQKQLPCTISGKLTSGRYTLPGDVSSQFITGLLFSLPLLCGDSEIRLTTPLQSADYVKMTLHALEQAEIFIFPTENGWKIPGNQTYRAGNWTVEGDWSNAAFWLCAGAIGGKIRLDGLLQNSAQGDRAVMDILRQFGAACTQATDCSSCSTAPLQAVQIDAGPIPDLIPILAVTAAFAKGQTEIINAARLRIKESDRLATTVQLLRDLGGQVEERPDGLLISGGGLLGGEVDGQNDHRIVMSAAIAACYCKEPVIIHGVQAVNKSYPTFFEDFKTIGGAFHVINMG